MEKKLGVIGASLNPRGRSKWVGPLSSGIVAWLMHRPFNWPDALASVVLGGFVVWLILASPLSYRMLYQTPRWLSMVWFCASIIGLVWLESEALPALHARF